MKKTKKATGPLLHRFKPKSKVEPPSRLPDAVEPLPINVAASFLVQRCCPKHESARAFRNKACGRIKYAVTNGHLRDLGGVVHFGEFIRWAASKRPYQKGVAGLSGHAFATISAMLPAIDESIRGLQLPLTVEECHAALLAADKRIAQLEDHLCQCQTRIEEMTPFVLTAVSN